MSAIQFGLFSAFALFAGIYAAPPTPTVVKSVEEINAIHSFCKAEYKTSSNPELVKFVKAKEDMKNEVKAHLNSKAKDSFNGKKPSAIEVRGICCHDILRAFENPAQEIHDKMVEMEKQIAAMIQKEGGTAAGSSGLAETKVKEEEEKKKKTSGLHFCRAVKCKLAEGKQKCEADASMIEQGHENMMNHMKTQQKNGKKLIEKSNGVKKSTGTKK